MNPEILQKLGRFCSYRERSASELLQKLNDLGVDSEEKLDYLNHLKELDVLNEERFARSFVRGKFRMKAWGRVRLQLELKHKQIPEELIERAISEEIDESAYLDQVDRAIEKKLSKLKEKNMYKRKAALVRYLQQRGFELDLIYERISRLEDDQ